MFIFQTIGGNGPKMAEAPKAQATENKGPAKADPIKAGMDRATDKMNERSANIAGAKVEEKKFERAAPHQAGCTCPGCGDKAKEEAASDLFASVNVDKKAPAQAPPHEAGCTCPGCGDKAKEEAAADLFSNAPMDKKVPVQAPPHEAGCTCPGCGDKAKETAAADLFGSVPLREPENILSSASYQETKSAPVEANIPPMATPSANADYRPAQPPTTQAPVDSAPQLNLRDLEMRQEALLSFAKTILAQPLGQTEQTVQLPSVEYGRDSPARVETYQAQPAPSIAARSPGQTEQTVRPPSQTEQTVQPSISEYKDDSRPKTENYQAQPVPQIQTLSEYQPQSSKAPTSSHYTPETRKAQPSAPAIIEPVAKAPKQTTQYVIGQYTYLDILTRPDLRKRFGYLIGLISEEENVSAPPAYARQAPIRQQERHAPKENTDSKGEERSGGSSAGKGGAHSDRKTKEPESERKHYIPSKGIIHERESRIPDLAKVAAQSAASELNGSKKGVLNLNMTHPSKAEAKSQTTKTEKEERTAPAHPTPKKAEAAKTLHKEEGIRPKAGAKPVQREEEKRVEAAKPVQKETQSQPKKEERAKVAEKTKGVIIHERESRIPEMAQEAVSHLHGSKKGVLNPFRPNPTSKTAQPKHKPAQEEISIPKLETQLKSLLSHPSEKRHRQIAHQKLLRLRATLRAQRALLLFAMTRGRPVDRRKLKKLKDMLALLDSLLLSCQAA